MAPEMPTPPPPENFSTSGVPEQPKPEEPILPEEAAHIPEPDQNPEPINEHRRESTKDIEANVRHGKALEAREVIKSKAENDASFARIIDQHEIKSETVEIFIAKQIEAGRSVGEMGIALKEAVVSGKQFDRVSTLDATRLLTVIAVETNAVELYVDVGIGSNGFKLYEEGELIPVDLGSTVQKPEQGRMGDIAYQKEMDKYNAYKRRVLRQEQQNNLKQDLHKFNEEIERLGLVGPIEAQRELRKIAGTILEGERTTVFEKIEQGQRKRYTRPPRYNKEETSGFIEKIRVQREQIEAEQQAKNAKFKLEKKLEQEERQRKIKDEKAKEKAKDKKERKKEQKARDTELDEKRKTEREVDMERREKQMFSGEDEYSSIRLERTVEVGMELDAEGMTREWMMDYYKPFGYPGGGEEEAQHRIRQYLGWMKSPRYRQEYFALRREFGENLERLPGTTKEEKTQFARRWLFERHDDGSFDMSTPVDQAQREFFERFKKHIVEYVEEHTDLKLSAAAIEEGEKIETILKFVSKGGDKMWYRVAAANNGANGMAFSLYDHNLKAIRRTDTSKVQRLGPDEFKRAKELTIAEIKSSPEYARRFGKAEGELLDDFEAEYLFNVARSLAKVRQKTVLAMLGGAGPSAILLETDRTMFGNVDWDKSDFIDASSDEQLAAAMDWVRYFTEKWHNLNEGQKRMLRQAYTFAAIDAGYEPGVDLEIQNLKRNGKTVTENGNVIHKTYRQVRDAALKEIWGEEGENFDLWKSTKRVTFMAGWDKDREFRQALLANKGKTVFSEILEMYDHDSNVWRGESVLSQVSAMYKEEHTIALGFWVRRIGNEFIGASADKAEQIFEHGSKSERDGNKIHPEGRTAKIRSSYWQSKEDLANSHYGLSVRAVLGVTADYRPQALGLELYEQNNQEFMTWSQTQQAKDLMTAMGIDSTMGFAEANDRIMRQYLMVQDACACEALPNLNYREGLLSVPVAYRKRLGEIIFQAAPPKRVIEKNPQTGEMEIKMVSLTLKERAIQTKAYLEFMKQLSLQVGKRAQIDAFKGPDFRRFFKRTQWTDDARFTQLEMSKQQPATTTTGEATMLTDIARARSPLSEQLVLEGEGRRSPLARTWGDFMVGKELISLVRKALSIDQKNLFECINKIVEGEEIYAGTGAALRSSIYIASGWLKTAMTDGNLTELLELGFLPNSSDQKRFFGDKGNSLGKSGLDHVLDAMDAVFSKMQLTPGMKDTVFKLEKYLGLGNEVKLFGKSIRLGRENLLSPLWRKRYALFLLVISALIVVEAGKTVKGSIDKETGGGK